VPNVEDPAQARGDVAFLGVPYDGSTNDRPGARFGPAAIRDASLRYHSNALEGWLDAERGIRTLGGVSMIDVGDVDIRTVDILDNFQRITEAASLVRQKAGLAVFLGGDHAIAFPLVQAFSDNPLTVVQFDAHQDFTDEKFGVRYSHDNEMRRISELSNVRRIVQIGLRGLLERTEPWEAAHRLGVQVVPSQRLVYAGVERALTGLHLDGDGYITVAIDVLNPVAAPGTGYPEPGGLTYYQLREALLWVAGRCRVVAIDLCEVNPLFDTSSVTARIAARIIPDVLGAVVPSQA
jgi:agmatinase